MQILEYSVMQKMKGKILVTKSSNEILVTKSDIGIWNIGICRYRNIASKKCMASRTRAGDKYRTDENCLGRQSAAPIYSIIERDTVIPSDLICDLRFDAI